VDEDQRWFLAPDIADIEVEFVGTQFTINK
jgi:hypothetical protein